MYAAIRRYTPEGSFDQAIRDQLKRQLENDFLPLAQEIPGFYGYYALTSGDQLVTISLYDTREGVTESTRRAKDFAKNNPMPIRVGAPEVIEGEVLLSREAGVGAR